MLRFFLSIVILCFSLQIRADAPKIMIGIDPGNPPFVFQINAGDIYSGFDIDLITEICKRIQASCSFKPMPFSSYFTALQSGEIQLAIGAITITNERQQSFLFSLPYMQTNTRFITLKQTPIDSITQLQSKKIGVINGSILVQYLNNAFGASISTIGYPDLRGILYGLQTDEIDAAFLDDATASFWKANAFNPIKIIGPKITIGSGYGIMGLKSIKPIMDKINQALIDMEDDGTYLKIYHLYFIN